MFDYSLTHWATFFTAATFIKPVARPGHGIYSRPNSKKGDPIRFCSHVWHLVRRLCSCHFCSAWLIGYFSHVGNRLFGRQVDWGHISHLAWHPSVALTWRHTICGWTSFPEGLGTRISARCSGCHIKSQGCPYSFWLFFPSSLKPAPARLVPSYSSTVFLLLPQRRLSKPPLILIGGKLTAYLSHSKKLSRWMDRGLGALFIGLGVKLATTDHA